MKLEEEINRKLNMNYTVIQTILYVYENIVLFCVINYKLL